ncbi:MAG: chalcone isomerase family protein [Bdellovibrionales bacterium]
MKKLLLTCAMLLPLSAYAAELPACLQAFVKEPLQQVGKGTFRKFAFTIYHADLWAPGGVYDPAKPYALRLTYQRDLDKGTLVDAITSDIRDQEVADEPTQTAWGETLDGMMTGVTDGESITGFFLPGKKAPLVHNCEVLGYISDPVLTKAFFAIWLGPKADTDMRAGLTRRDDVAE